jgi:carboxyl-terminal processing protease
MADRPGTLRVIGSGPGRSARGGAYAGEAPRGSVDQGLERNPHHSGGFQARSRLDKHLGSGQGAEIKDPAREKARDEARKKAEDEARKGPTDRKIPEFGTDKDFQLVQALNQLKGRPVLISKTMVERKEEKKEN